MEGRTRKAGSLTSRNCEVSLQLIGSVTVFGTEKGSFFLGSFDVFLRHIDEDRELAQNILSFLRQECRELKFWADCESSNVARVRANEILSTANEASVLLLLGTNTAFRMGSSQPETGVAAQKRLLDEMPLVILAFDPPHLPNALRNFQYIDCAAPKTGVKDLAAFLRTEFQAANDRPWSVSRGEVHGGQAAKDAKASCFDVLSAMSRCDLRYRIGRSIARPELAVLWYELFESRMDAEVPYLPAQNAALEMLLRGQREGLIPRLIQAICRDYPHIGRLNFSR